MTFDREKLAKTLHRISFFDDSRNWDPDPRPEMSRFNLSEETKNSWRYQADRFLDFYNEEQT